MTHRTRRSALTETCTVCDGTMQISTACPVCEGSGRLGEGRGPICPACNGLKKRVIPCTECGGKGWHYVFDPAYVPVPRRTL